MVGSFLVTSPAPAGEPLRLHPDNPHYLLLRDKPTVLITSGEHYGAVLNRDFDYRPYLDELQSHGLNQTRTFTGAYCEPPGAFNIKGNTLAPAEGRLIGPWARSETPGYANGGNKFDLTQWDEKYFRRLKNFVAEAGKRDIVVELVLFCPFYKDDMWNLSPMNISNNVNLIAQNIANGSKKITEPNPDVSIFNFHYATPPTTVKENYGRDRVIGDDETGFKGSEDVTYRREGWEFILAGGGIYGNLDYSFTTEHEDGTAKPDAPGGGGENLRKQLGILKRFMDSFDFVRMNPDESVIQGGVPEEARAWALADSGRAYAIYVSAGEQANFMLELPAGRYNAEWINTKTGSIDRDEQFVHEDGIRQLESPAYSEDIALRIKRSDR